MMSVSREKESEEEDGLTSADEGESIPRARSLEGAEWQNMHVGQQSSGKISQRFEIPRWSGVSPFKFGGGLEVGGGAAQTEGWMHHLGQNPLSSRAWAILGGVIAALFLAIALRGGGTEQGSKSPMSAGTSRRRDRSSIASPLLKQLRGVSEKALALGVTSPLHTTFEIVRWADERQGDAQGDPLVPRAGMDFIVSLVSQDALAAKKAIDKEETVTGQPRLGNDERQSTTAATFDPFDAKDLDARLTVQELPPSHTMVLNKFNTMADHALIVTREFRPQEEALSESDFGAWYKTVRELPGAGFYNSADEAGASQRHKHMQVIPEDSFWDYRPDAAQAIPVDEPIAAMIGSSRDLAKIWCIPSFGFEHALTLLPTKQELRAGSLVGNPDMERDEDFYRVMAEHIRHRYVDLLDAVGFDTSELGMVEPRNASLPPYNAILTTNWLLVVPRSTKEWERVDVNGMGFLGALLVKGRGDDGDSDVEFVRRLGPMAILNAVTVEAR